MFDFFSDFQSAKQAYDKVLNGKAVFIDIREREELESGLVKDALWLPMSQLQQNGWLEKLQNISKDKEIFLYCRSGGRASNLQNYLRQHGVKTENLGGFESIRASNVPVQNQFPSSSLLETSN